MRGGWGAGSGGSLTPHSLRSIPAVSALLIATVVVFLLWFIPATSGLTGLFHFVSGGWLVAPWTLVTYPFVVTDPLTLLLEGYWLYFVGGMLERSWGWRRFLGLFFALTAIASAAFIPAYYLFGNVLLAQMTLPLSALTVTWAALDPEMEIYFWGIVPLRLKVMAAIDVLLVYLYFGLHYRNPILALFTLVAPAAGWLYVRRGLPLPSFSFPSRPRRQAPPPLLREDVPRERTSRTNPLRRRQEQIEIERLRKLLGEDDDGSPAHR